MKRISKSLFARGIILILLNLALAQSRSGEWFTISPGELCVTEGAIEKSAGDRMSFDVPKMRAYVMSSEQSIEVRFRYLGATAKESALGSGQVRRQVGLKLRAQDACNLVYVMWRIDPESKLVVSVKRNPSAHTSAECGNRGYTSIKPLKALPVPRLQPGESHTLRAEMKSEELRVFADNHEVWEGLIPEEAAALEGPVGIRSDNARLEFDLKVRAAQGRPWACKSGDSD